MKKGVFLPMIVVFLIILIPLLGSIFYSNIIKSKTDVVGEKSADILDSITKAELTQFYIEESARLAWYNSLEELASTTGGWCMNGDYPVWDINLVPEEELCDPQYYEENFEDIFRSNLEDYLNRVNLYLDYNLEINENDFKITPINIINLDKSFDNVELQYSLKPIFVIKEKNNLDDYKNLIYCSGDEDCLKNIGATLVYEDTEIKKYEYTSINNPLTLQSIKIKFSYAKNVSEFFLHEDNMDEKDKDNYDTSIIKTKINTKKDTGKFVVVIDPGHDGTSGKTGTAYKGILEKVVNLKLSFYLKEELEKYDNIKVVMTRTTDKVGPTTPLSVRRNIAIKNNADIIISNHNNCPNCGTMILVPTESFTTYSGSKYDCSDDRCKKSLKLANYVKEELETVRDKKYPFRPYCWSSKRQKVKCGMLTSKIPSIIIEYAAINDPALTNEKELKEMAVAVSKAVLEYASD